MKQINDNVFRGNNARNDPALISESMVFMGDRNRSKCSEGLHSSNKLRGVKCRIWQHPKRVRTVNRVDTKHYSATERL